MNLSVTIGNKILSNPVGVASGTFGYGSEYETLVNLDDVGAIYTKAVTFEPRVGNNIPRIIETPSGMLNSIGLANVGVRRFLSEKMPFLSTLKSAIVVNVAGATEDEYIQVVETLESHEVIWGYEINISCPNVKKGAMAFGTDCPTIERLTLSLRKLTTKPLILKLTPNVTDIAETARAAEAGGADAVSCINTLVGMVIDTCKKTPVLSAKTGGLSGPAIRPVGVAMTYKVSRAVTIPVIGMGGIMTADDALQYLLAGATAIQVGTGNFVDPRAVSDVLAGIIAFGERESVAQVGDIRNLMQ